MRYWQLGSAAPYVVTLIFSEAQGAALTVDNKQCGKACRQTFRTLRFVDAPKGVFFVVQECSSLLYQRSLYLCWDIHCTKDVWHAEMTSLNHTCQDINGSNFPKHDIIDGLTDRDVGQITRFNATSPARSQPIDVLILPSQAWFDLWGRTLDAHDCIWDYHYYYGWAMGIFLAAVVSVGIVNRVLAYRSIRPKRTRNGSDRTVLRHVSDRTGIISLANFPLIWLFGMRNNLVIWLTGWDFKTYNNFHRWVGRIAALQAVIHSIGYTALILQRGGWDYFWRMCNMTYWWTGELATILMCLLVGLSVFWFRRRQYETFLVLHIILSILILIIMIYHVSIFNGDYDPLVWTPVIIWVLDRVLRGARILAFNPRFWKTNASISYNENAHLIHIAVPVSTTLYKTQPGTFYYLMVLNKWKFWESHPFTVASVSGSGQYDAELGENSPLLGQGPVLANVSRGCFEKSHQEMTFLIRPYDSFTFFIVGGSGIAVPLSCIKSLTSSIQPKLIEVHWAVRQSALAIDILDHELNDTLQNDRVKIYIYLTDATSTWTGDQAIYRLAECRYKRLNVEVIIDRALDSGRDSLAVVTNGPSRMADESRSVVTARIKLLSPHIQYFEESFQY